MEAFDRVVLGNLSPDLADSLHNMAEVYFNFAFDFNTEFLSLNFYCVGYVCCCKEGFGRHTAEIETVTAHKLFLNDGNLSSDSFRTSGRNQSASPCPDDKHVISILKSN